MKKTVAIILVLLVSFISIIGVNAKEENNIDLFLTEKLEEYCELINGCSYAALKNYEDDDIIDAVVYSGLDVSDPKILFNVGVFYVSNNVDFSKLTSDVKYSTNLVVKFDNYLKNKGIENAKAQNFFNCHYNAIKDNLKLKFNTLGAYTFKAKKQDLEKILEDNNTDFVIVGSKFMLKKGDLNADGKINKTDLTVLNETISKKYSYLNSLEEKFMRYVSDYNEDNCSDVDDVTNLQMQLLNK